MAMYQRRLLKKEKDSYVQKISLEMEKDPLDISDAIKEEKFDDEFNEFIVEDVYFDENDQESIDEEFLDEEFLDEEIENEDLDNEEFDNKYEVPTVSVPVKSAKRTKRNIADEDSNKKSKHTWVNPERLKKQSIEYKDLKEMLSDYKVSSPFMDEEIFCELLSYVKSEIKRQDTTMRLSIKPEERLAASLTFLTSFDSFKQISERTKRVSTAYLSVALWDVCSSICRNLKSNFFQFPDSKESWQQIANDFEQKYSFPCLGVLDARLIRFQAIKTDASLEKYKDFNGKKSFYFFMLIDAFGKFLYIDVGAKGSLSFEEALGKTGLMKIINNPEQYFPNSRKVGNFQLPYGFVASERFNKVSKLLTPCTLNDELTLGQKMLNQHIAKLNNSLENAYKLMKTHLKAIEKTNSFNLNKAIEIVRCCCMLHNFLISKQSPLYKVEDQFEKESVLNEYRKFLFAENKLNTLMDENLFYELLKYIKPDEESETSTPETKLALNLSFFSSYETISLIAQRAKLTPENMRTSFIKFCSSLSRNLKRDYLMFPNTKEDWLSIANSFEQKFNFPCLGVIGGKRIPFSPTENETYSKEYTDCYGSNSIYLFMLIDAFGKFRYIEIGQKGSLSFEEALRQSDLWKNIKNSNKLFPSAKKIDGFKLPYVFVSNELFENIPEILTPYRSNTFLKPAEDNLNVCLAQLNESFETVFETMKFHLKAVRKTFGFNRLQTIQIIRCCCTLHNFFKTKQNPLYFKRESKIKDQQISKHENLDLIQKRRILRDAFRNYYSRNIPLF